MPRILVIEDMPDSANMMAEILRQYGHEVLIATTGADGLLFAQDYHPDLIICDYLLPDVDSKSFLTDLANGQRSKSKIVVCSATPQSILEQASEIADIDGFVPKPYRLSELMAVVEAQLA